MAAQIQLASIKSLSRRTEIVVCNASLKASKA